MADHHTSAASSHSSDHTSEKEVKSPNLLDRAKKGFDAAFHRDKSPRHHKETHGTSSDIDETTPIAAVKGPNVFQRVIEEVEAIVETVHSKKDSEKGLDTAPHRSKSPRHHRETHGTSDDINETTPVDEVKGPNVFQRVKEEVEAIAETVHSKNDSKKGLDAAPHCNKSPHHHKETHGTSDDIDETTPIDVVKGPNVFQRVKEEVEAIVEAVHSKKDLKEPK